MHSLAINRLGPINHIEIECKEFSVITGSQASGKSTLVKTIFFFRTIKDDILSLLIKRSTDTADKGISLRKAVENSIREKFLRVFGSSWGMNNQMYITYYYNSTTYIKVRLKENYSYDKPNYLWIEYSDDIRDYLRNKDRTIYQNYLSLSSENKELVRKELAELFSDDYETVFIPAGRSLITLLATQLNYIYSMMEDAQKNAIDYCTRNYLERVIRIKPEFEHGLDGLTVKNDQMAVPNRLIERILKGSYRYNSGDERLQLDNRRYVKINFTSSGQQESVWILNLIYYYLVNKQKVHFIIEEPESHLFPDAQKSITELIAFSHNFGNSIFLTTHSPYILGSLNNLLMAGKVSVFDRNRTISIINDKLWTELKDFSAFFIEDGLVIDVLDNELGLIKNEVIDDISSVINDEYNELFDIQMKSEMKVD